MERHLKQAWIARWVGFGDPEQVLKKNNLKDTVFDFLSARHDFDTYIIPYAENIYRLRFLSLTERFALAHYNHRQASRHMFGTAVPVMTYRSGGPYRELQQCFETGDQSVRCKELKQKWKNYPQYVIVGHNPAVEVVKVFNFRISDIEDGCVHLTWERPMANGDLVKESQKTKDLLQSF